MESNPGPAEGFVLRLLSNPALEGLTALQKEEQILQFLEANPRALYPALSSVRFFPGCRWADIMSRLGRSLVRATDASLLPWLEQWVHRDLELGFLEAIAARSLPEQAVRRALWDLLLALLQRPRGRRALAGPLTAVQRGLAKRYLEALLRRRRYVYSEITKVERLRLELEGTHALVAATLALRPSILLPAVEPGPADRELPAGRISPRRAAAALAALRSRFAALPPSLLRAAVSSNCSFVDDRRVAASARLAAIFAARGREHNPRLRADRGAATPDSSWFNIARHNCRYYGFDLAMLDELHAVAAENGW